MARWFGKVGYSNEVEEEPGKWIDNEIVREYYGDVIKNSYRRFQGSDTINDDLTLNSQISIVADSFANNAFYAMKWIEFMGVKWKIINVEPQLPRLLLTLGGVWNE